jgi:peptidoglycan hydrolase-like protein with peptidoglycan-binding domain
MTGEDVRILQKILNSLGFIVAKSGAGSPGHESVFFGPATNKALKALQVSAQLPSIGYFGPMTKAYVKKLGK